MNDDLVDLVRTQPRKQLGHSDNVEAGDREVLGRK
jgi:hypothetical protein